jgi:hypothetical protein
VTVDITPHENREYITTFACPEAITNALEFIERKLAEPNALKHTHLMLEYSLDYAAPSSKYLAIIDRYLERRGINYRMHSAHVRVPEEKTRLILRKTSLIDLTTPETELGDWELNIERVMLAYSRQYNQPLIVSPSNITVFKQPTTSNYYWVYTRVFDMWHYNDNFPEVGWQEI